MKNTRQTLRDFIERETLDENRMQALLDMQPAPRRRWPATDPGLWRRRFPDLGRAP